MSKINIKCSDGFVNQLRLALAANFLVKKGFIQEANQEWIINNHNIVDFNKFFNHLPFVNFKKIEDSSENITNFTFSRLIRNFGSPQDTLKESFQDLILKEKYKNLFDNFMQQFNIKNSIGLHVRTGCKTALLTLDKRRHSPLSHFEVIDFLNTNNKKIFLATDNKETQEKFIKIFKDRIIFFEKINEGKEDFGAEYNKDLVKRYTSDIHVVADFCILKQCNSFIGSNESSFSIMIHWLRNNNFDYPIKGFL